MNNRLSPLHILILATFVVFTVFMWQGNKGFNLWDEGFLWYGVQRVMLGEVPLRDFMSYDPGRYYWSAALLTLWGDSGLLSLRGTVAVFQTIGLFIGLLLIARTEEKRNLPYLILSAVILMAWMWMYYKFFDISLSILLIGSLAFLAQAPTSRRYFLTGLFIGFIAVFGRNHGVYGVAGSAGVMLWLSIKRVDGPGLFKGFALWATGVAVGFSPIVFMAWLVPGFAVAFWDSILFLFEVRKTNLPLPVPWPWRVEIGSSLSANELRDLLIGLFFIAIVLFGMLSIVWVVFRKLKNEHVSSALVATSFLILPYAHYAFSRADVAHLALGIYPFLIGCLVFLATLPAKVKWPVAGTLCAASLWVMHVFHPGWQCQFSKKCVDIMISGSEFAVHPSKAREIELLRGLADRYAPDGQSFLVAPFWPGAYPLLERKSPMWEIYPILPRPKAFQEAEIERIKAARPAFALVIDLALDGRDDLRFRNTRPLIHQHILDHFERLPDSPNPAYQIYKAKRDME